jgi:uncharacterized surface protein with fasciclin (FAS1) repeats
MSVDIRWDPSRERFPGKDTHEDTTDTYACSRRRRCAWSRCGDAPADDGGSDTEAAADGSVAGFRSVPRTFEPTGPACADVPADGDGSFEGMADDTAAVAASNNPELSTLVAAVDAAALTDTLNGAGPFTIFAPSNDAFDKIPTNVLDSILADTDLLTSILTYHVVSGEALSSTDLADVGTAETVNGESLDFALDGDTLFINGQEAAVVCADITVGNGIVHIIDSVLQPPTDDLSGGGSSSSAPSSAPDVTATSRPMVTVRSPAWLTTRPPRPRPPTRN